MKKVFRCFAFILILCLILAVIVVCVPDEFQNSYQRALVRQYDYFKSIEGKKIVFIGGSSLSFGFDMNRMEELTGMPCPILGNHAGYGMVYLLEMSKENLNHGDIVVIEYCDGTVHGTGGAELLLTGVGKRYDMHRFFVSQIRWSLVKAIPAYVQKNINYWRSGEPYNPDLPYSIHAYDNRGNMTMNRPEPWITEAYINHAAEEDLFYRDYYSLMKNMNYELFSFLNEYISYCNELGVSVYITVQPVYDDAVPDYCGEDIIGQFDQTLRDEIHAPLISNSIDYFFERQYIFDGYLHL